MHTHNPDKRKLSGIISEVLIALSEVPREPNGDAWVTGQQLQEATNLSPAKINDAIEMLGKQGYVDLQETYNTAPFEFTAVSLNVSGRLELERRQSKAVPKSTQVKKNDIEWDLFISHASEDKDEIVRPLAAALKKAGFRVWYDEFTLTIGDSLRRSIDKGLAQSRFGLVVLSPDFFKKEWPQRELDGLVARETDGKKVILPLWHKVDRAYVAKFSPTLADRVAVSTSEGISKIVEAVSRAVRPIAREKEKPPKVTEGSAVGRLDYVINFMRNRSKESITGGVRDMEFEDLERMFLDVLDGVAFFGLSDSRDNANIFDFIKTAIIEKSKEEGALLFEKLLDWYFATVTPNCKYSILEIFAHLTSLSHLKEVISRTNRTGSFVAEFGVSHSYDIAGINAEILQNIQKFLTRIDCEKNVNFALSNDQILGSWRAKDYLRKIASSCEAKVDRERIEELLGLLT